MILTPEEQAVLDEVNDHVIYIPSRKSPHNTPELWQKRFFLKSLAYKNLVRMDVDFDNQCLLFYSTDPQKIRITAESHPWFDNEWPEEIQ